MCGIVGLATRESSLLPWLLDGLSRLEYRGYDSAGVALLGSEGLYCKKAVGPLAELRSALSEAKRLGQGVGIIQTSWFGVAHTRWATHGAVTEANAHPQTDGQTVVVHNGIIENVAELRQELPHVELQSQTDTELLVHLITQEVQRGTGLADAVRRTVDKAQGTMALLVLNTTMPHQLVAFRRGSPLAVARLHRGQGFALASDVMAFASLSSESFDLEDEDLCVFQYNGQSFSCQVWGGDGTEGTPAWTPLAPLDEAVAPCEDLTWKEIGEQPSVLRRLSEAHARGCFDALAEELLKHGSMKIIGCGSSYYASLIGQYLFEAWGQKLTQAELASEFRYRSPVLARDTFGLFLSQSGETRDTLQALAYVQQKGIQTGVLTNVGHSSMAKRGDFVVPLMAGAEVSVVSTKAFTAQLAVLMMVLIQELRLRGAVEVAQRIQGEVEAVPGVLEEVLQISDSEWQPWVQCLAQASTILFLGRGVMYPLALEGALKLKETAYLHAEGYPAGELKHGPIALIDPQSVCVFLAPSDELFPKVMSNAQEILARGGTVLFFTDVQGARALQRLDLPAEKIRTLTVPATTDVTKIFVYAVLGQVLAYKVAKFRGCNVDRPRNLAKSVTVE